MPRSHSDSESDSDSETEDLKKYGEPHTYDPSFKGPVENRGCTDIICCLIFAAFLFGEAIIAYIAITNGDPSNVFNSEDYLGQVCGVNNTAVENKTSLFYFDWLDCLQTTSLTTLRCPTTRVCVEHCTEGTYSISGRYETQLKTSSPNDVDWNDFVCRYDVDPEKLIQEQNETIRWLLDKKLCAEFYWHSESYDRRCIPTVMVEGNISGLSPPHRNVTQDEIDNGIYLFNRLESSTAISKIIDDFWNTWPLILGFLGVTAILAFICLILMRWLATVMIVSSFVLSIIVFTFGSYYTWTKYLCYTREEAECLPKNMDDPDFDYYSLDSYAQLSTTWLVFAIILTLLGFIELLIALIMCKRFRIALNVLELASDALPYMICTLFWPVVPFALTIGYVFYWAVITVYLASASVMSYAIFNATVNSSYTNDQSCSPATFILITSEETRCEPIDYSVDNYFIVFHIYNLVSLFWVVNFILALGEMTLAGAFASFYWAKPKPEAIPRFPLGASFYRSLRYHIGSLALGSLIITIVEFIRAILEYIETQASAANNCCTKFIFKCCKCCMWCLEKFLRFINRNAYIDIAVYGHSFCRSAVHVFNLLMRNFLRVMVLNSVTGFMLLVLKLMITTLVTVGSFYFFSWQSSIVDSESKEILTSPNYLWAPVAIIAVLSLAICSAFFSVYDMAVDTMFISFLEDIERNDGSSEKPYYMPKGLLNLIGKKNKT